MVHRDQALQCNALFPDRGSNDGSDMEYRISSPSMVSLYQAQSDTRLFPRVPRRKAYVKDTCNDTQIGTEGTQLQRNERNSLERISFWIPKSLGYVLA